MVRIFEAKNDNSKKSGKEMVRISKAKKLNTSFKTPISLPPYRFLRGRDPISFMR